ncbi:pyruvate dehydrogenase complex dihydrolipoamide acetyltransferase [Cokeromyces recurvatus]|uniref:pyruvate dehydrogenase complex dihydrolipoamide acetyltransferase n=1 Tax=Cokeromyces recurvatus TaxID=90255 RepID=UPI002220BA01|nr:pyruvate dehydrogenase complex dihydrolipoamide acetyltransferase [Cokeromyces recurvatus]KAI7903501.1 pyruvate dehydrogenase complex dihydrolipoamide acetyltransferase [Cokeromyces recurvatus]
MSAAIRRQVMRGLVSTTRITTKRMTPVLIKHVSARAFTSTSAPRFIALRALGNQVSTKDIRLYSSSSFPSHNVVAMPALSPTMTAGGIGVWQKKVGDEIQPGDVLVEIETDKAQMDFECQDEGYLAKILVDTGAKDVAVGQPIAIFVDDAESVTAFENFTLADIQGNEPAAATSEKPKVEKVEAPAASNDTSKNESTPVASHNGRVLASPLARKLADERSIDISQVKGSGPQGIISKEDVENYKASAASSKVATSSAPAQIPTAYAPQNATGEAYKDIPTTSMRKIIAERLTESKQQVPHYYLTVEINMDKTNKLREVLNKSAEGKYKLSVNDFVIKASALALKSVPEVNAAWQGDFIRQYNTADICVAVATPSGLITPIVTSAESKGLSTISSQVRDLAKRARDGKLAPQEYQGGTFTISNLGMYGINNFTAIINPPQSCILAVGGAQQKVVPDETSETGFSVRNVMEVTLSADHRVVDGAVGATWLQSFKSFMENPLKMLL